MEYRNIFLKGLNFLKTVKNEDQVHTLKLQMDQVFMYN
ncbi:hypothetical protein SD77_2685 [Bacillus badius]|uniref:Mobile element protein n=1 Tax=Bacillus badius TaxID=1455 RepID=A0ABR5AQ80_BACBA|nr:hypothetical protein SD78_1138 [Bacillus badius]KIL76900.1 hypothetical protein SD77_2685 [Bacillus badius]